MSDEKLSSAELPEHWKPFGELFEKQELAFTDTVRSYEGRVIRHSLHTLLPRISMSASEDESAFETSVYDDTGEFPDPVEFELKEVLARGGMGRICKAVQVPLQREVAIKMLRSDRRTS